MDTFTGLALALFFSNALILQSLILPNTSIELWFAENQLGFLQK